MGYLLFWTESLAASLLWVATVAACTSRWATPPRAWLLRTAQALAVVSFGLGGTVLLGNAIDFQVRIGNTVAAHALMWITAVVTGALAAIVLRGVRLLPRIGFSALAGVAPLALSAWIDAMVVPAASGREDWVLTPARAILSLLAGAGGISTVLVWGLWRGRRWSIVGLSVLLPLGGYAVLDVLAGWIDRLHVAPGWLFPCLVAVTIAFVLGASWLLFRGLQRGVGQEAYMAATWAPGRLAVALVVVVVLHAMTFWNMDLAARQQLAALRTEAGALALSVAPPRLPDRDNAAPVYQQAFEVMGRNEAAPGSPPWDEAWVRKWDQAWVRWYETGEFDFDARDTELRGFLKKQASTLALLRRGASKPGCYFERDYGRPSLAMLLPEIQPMRTGARLLAMDAVVKAADGDRRGALEDVQAIFGMAEHLGADALLVPMVAAIGIDATGVSALQVVLASGPISAEELSAIDLGDTLYYRRLLQRSLRSEEAFRLATFEQVGNGQYGLTEIVGMTGDSFSPAPWYWTPVYRVFLLSADLNAHRHLTETYAMVGRRPFGQDEEMYESFDRELGRDPGGLLTAILTPALRSVVRMSYEGDARRGLAKLALGACAYRAKHGRWPDDFESLAPEYLSAVPRDPFDGKPLRLRRAEHGLVLYSIGSDMTDGGGVSSSPSKHTGDITLALPR